VGVVLPRLGGGEGDLGEQEASLELAVPRAIGGEGQ
jgi:hypothetical protein